LVPLIAVSVNAAFQGDLPRKTLPIPPPAKMPLLPRRRDKINEAAAEAWLSAYPAREGV
jgi:hypothetical protein